ncbi:hypothetical protein M8J76_010663 [Diaphorina citri]|nr:hypothetical protein M8J76_010663 [Diaphorina citri]
MAMGIHYWPALLDMTEEQCKVKLRCMELEAYSCIVSVLRARGPLTEEKLNFMKQCAKEFHISQERHKVEIRKASNDELLSTIADTLYGPNTESKWFIEGRRLAPVLNTEPRQSVYIELANRMAEIARAHNASLPSYSQYKDEVITIENAHLKREEEALVEDLAKATKEKETPTSVPDVVESTSITTTTTTITTASTTSPSTQIIEIMEEDVLEDGKVSEEEKQSVEVKAPPSPRGEKREAPPSSKSPQGRRKKRLSIEMIKDDGSSTPPKRFSNIPPPRIPATPVSQRPPRFQSINTTPHQPSPRIVVLPGSSVRKPMSKPSGPPPPPIISKIQRPRMFTPMKTLNFSAGPDARMKSSAPSPVSSTSGGGVTKANNLILLQKTNKMSGNTTTTLPNRITIANPNKKEPVSKFLVNRPMAPQTTVSSTGGKSVILKSAGSSSQNNVILVDITQDQLSGNLSVEELLKVSGLSSTPGTVANTSVSKTPTTPQHSIIKLQNPKSLGSLPTNIQQIKIIKSSGTKLFLPTSVGSTMETVLSLAQSSTVSSSTTMSSSFTSSSTTGMGPRMSVAPVSNASPSTPRPALSRFTPNTPRPVSAPYKAPNPAVTHSTVSSSTSHTSSLADWLSNYVVSDKDIESDNSPLFEDVADKSNAS